MPVHPRGRGCFQWGHHGKVYCGPGARAKAARQGRAAYAHGYQGREVRAGRPRDAAIGIVFDRAGRILTVTRPDPPHEPAIPGGEVDAGESPVEACARELWEETGVEGTVFEELPGIRSPADGRLVHVFRIIEWAGEAADREPDVHVAWLTRGELLAAAGRFRSSVRELWPALVAPR